MKLDKNVSVSDTVIKEVAQKSKKDILKWLSEQPVYKGISVKIREQKLESLYNEIKRYKTKATKSDTSGNSRGNAEDTTSG